MPTEAKAFFYVACVKERMVSGSDIIDFPDGTFRILGKFNDLSAAIRLFQNRYAIAVVNFTTAKPQFVSWALGPKTL